MIYYVAVLATLQTAYVCYKEYQRWKVMRYLW